ncbi:MAG: hypothetical protein QNJ54_16430 [Prochloraceae cyanobacterium]|nr:hypothetical protein [Prochloraceae cyanobacterium]
MSSALDRFHQNLSLPTPFSKILSEEIANGLACSDTVKTYRQQFKLFVSWCDLKEIRYAVR